MRISLKGTIHPSTDLVSSVFFRGRNDAPSSLITLLHAFFPLIDVVGLVICADLFLQ